MRGFRAKVIRKSAKQVWDILVKKYPKLSLRRLYQKMKKEYTQGNI